MPITDETIICFIPDSTWHHRDMDKGILHCELCDDEIHKPHYRTIYCKPCAVINRRVMDRINEKIKRRLQGKPVLTGWVKVGEIGKCGDCGGLLFPTRKARKYCKPCRTRHAQKFIGTSGNCVHCDAEIIHTSATHKYCTDCAKTARAHRNKRIQKVRRLKAGKRFLGMTIPCTDCGNDMVYRSGAQKRCKDCSRKNRNAHRRKLRQKTEFLTL